ncbi:MAG: hypothetical protein R3B93_29215 [Bacteroidia bacterium]
MTTLSQYSNKFYVGLRRCIGSLGLVYNHAFAQPAGTFKDITFQFASIDEGRDFLGPGR